ncbi:MAG TPA: Gfo/Idh/MocA family oxidoreductase, partial [Gemmataceae bacterium]|nr:Gfo/Idh/MocA family oxidoreductase [Gemmataceae bacterium]
DVIKVGLIGCGGRGTGAGDNVLHSAKGVKIVALGDAFGDRLNGCRGRLEDVAKNDDKVKELGNSVDVDGRCFTGLDAFEHVLKTDANYIILATPPGFRPTHLQAAVAAGKNIFTEKPVGVDTAGIHKVFEAYEDAKKKNLAIVAGTQRRHQKPYLETMKLLHDGAIGDLVGGHCHWDQGILWKVPRKPEWSDLVAQMRNWYNFVWLCGDHIVEQHVHNIDVMNWAMKSHPVKAVSMGFRTRTDPDFGHIYDFFSTGFEYPNGVHVQSTCRQISQCANNISESVQGTKGQCQISSYTINGKRVARGRGTDPYVQEHTDLIESIRKGQPLNELKQVAESTLTAIMARMSAYTGKEVTWDFVVNKSKEDLMPAKLSFEMSLPVPPVAIPGKTALA